MRAVPPVHGPDLKPVTADEHASDMTYVDASVTAIARTATEDSLIVGKSTVPVGSARRPKALSPRNRELGHPCAPTHMAG